MLLLAAKLPVGIDVVSNLVLTEQINEQVYDGGSRHYCPDWPRRCG
jgi:hypothetical protein